LCTTILWLTLRMDTRPAISTNDAYRSFERMVVRE
jgi:hypothetical protein